MMKADGFGILLAMTGVALFFSGAVRAADAPANASGPDSTRAILARWVETQTLIAREKKDWDRAREILKSRIEMVSREIDQITGRIEETRRSGATAENERGDLLAQARELKETSASLGAQIGELEAGVRRLYNRLPGSTREKLLPLYRRIPEQGKLDKVSLAERFQNVLGVLNEIDRFNSEITVASEIRALSDGKPSEVKTVYVGLGQAYYVSARGEAGIGCPGEGGWSWRPENRLAPEINRMLEILQNKSTPSFISLPVEIR
jgi:hypothetical protein